MKTIGKSFLVLSAIICSTILVGCQYQDGSSAADKLLYNSFHYWENGSTSTPSKTLGIYKADIPGFENAVDANPTPVTITLSGGADAAYANNCQIVAGNNQRHGAGIYTIEAPLFGGPGFDSTFGWIFCENSAPAGVHSMDIGVAFIVNNVHYNATTTLSVTAL